MKRLLYIFILTIGFLAACTQVSNQPELESLAITNISQIKWLTISASTAKELSSFNCAVNELNLSGQGYRANASDGGMTYDVRLTTDTGVTTAASRGQDWNKMPGMLAPIQRDTMMLVVDDFRGDAQGNNAVYKPLPDLFLQSELNIATLQSLQANNKLSHGALVFQHAKDVIWGSGRYLGRSTPTPDVAIFYTDAIPSRFSKKLIVKAINTKFESTGVIAGSITSVAIANKLTPILRDTAQAMIVVNLSFSLMPCEAYADFIATDKLSPDDLTFQHYLKMLATFNRDTFDNLARVIVRATNVTNDPLLTLIQSFALGAKRHIFVAASGNYGFKTTSMYPAKWPGVVNVSGSAANNPSLRHERFNTGEIMDVAASFLLKASSFTSNPNAKNVYYLGTSFSAPTVSAYSAIDVASQQRCISGVPSNYSSKLAINGANLIETPLGKAVNTLCVP